MSGASTGSRFLRETILTTVLGVVGKGVGFVVPIFVAYVYGADATTDAFFFGYGVIFFAVGIFSNAIEASVVPFLVEARQTSGARAEGALLGSLATFGAGITAAFAAALVAVVAAALPSLTRLGEISLARRLLIEVAPIVSLTTLSSLFHGALVARGSYWLPSLSPAVRGVLVLSVAFSFRNTLGVHALALAYVAAETARAGIAAAVLVGAFRVPLRFERASATGVGRFAKAASVLAASSAVIGLAPLVDRTVASYLEPGSVALLEYARTLFFVPVAALCSGFLVVTLSRSARGFHGDDDFDLRKAGVAHLRPLLVVSGACAVVGILLRNVAVAVVYGRTLGAAESATVASTFGWLLASVPAYVTAGYAAQSYVIARATWPLLRGNGVALVVVAAADFLLVPALGVPGIGVANLLGFTVLAWVLWSGVGTLPARGAPRSADGPSG